MVLILALLALLVSSAASAQTQTVPSGPVVQHVICDSGCGGGTTDTDDGSIAGGQTVGLVQGQTNVWDGAVWRRLGFGQAAMASSLPVAIASDQSTLTVQLGGVSALAGDASGTPSVINVGAYGLYYDGASFYRTRGDASGAYSQIRFGGATIDPRSIRALTNADVVTAQISQFGGSNVVTGTGASGAGIPRVTISNDSSLAANQSVNVAQVGGTNVSTLAGASVGTEAGMPVRPIMTARTNTANLTAACSAANIDACGAGSTVELIIGGYNGVAVALTNTGFATTMAVDWTINGSHWVATVFVINSTTGTATVPASGKDLQVVLATGTTTVDMATAVPAGAQKVRVRLQTLTTSGTTLTSFIAANTNSDIYGLNLSGQTAGRAAGAALPTLIGGADGTTGCTLLGVASFPCIQNANITAKGTQGSFALVTQPMADTGRTAKSLYANNVASGTTTTETLITLTISSGTGATSSASTYTITSGKTFRIQNITVGSRGNATATIQISTFNLRLNTGGACLVSSTPILAGIATATAAVASDWDRAQFPIPDGYEITGDGTKAICISANAVFTTNAPTWFVNIIGYEY